MQQCSQNPSFTEKQGTSQIGVLRKIPCHRLAMILAMMKVQLFGLIIFVDWEFWPATSCGCLWVNTPCDFYFMCLGVKDSINSIYSILHHAVVNFISTGFAGSGSEDGSCAVWSSEKHSLVTSRPVTLQNYDACLHRVMLQRISNDRRPIISYNPIVLDAANGDEKRETVMNTAAVSKALSEGLERILWCRPQNDGSGRFLWLRLIKPAAWELRCQAPNTSKAVVTKVENRTFTRLKAWFAGCSTQMCLGFWGQPHHKTSHRS